MKKTKNAPEEKEEKSNEPVKVEYSNAFVLKEKKLTPFSTDYETATKISTKRENLIREFKSENELAEIVLNNGKILFGENTALVDMHKQSILEFSLGFYPDGMLFVAGEKPKVFLLEVILSKENLASLFLQMTQLFSFFKNKENIARFKETLGKAINRDIGIRNKMKKLLAEKSIAEFLEEAVKDKPTVLLIMNAPIPELTGFTETYTETWGKYVKPILLQKFAVNGDTIITIVPKFSEINGKKPERDVKSTEEDHLTATSEMVKEIFLHIKEELLKVDSSLEFRVKQYYISLRKNRNLAFFQLGKKKLSIVIANPEKDMQKKISYHKTLTLAESVKKFWNGNEYCFTVVVEHKEHLHEVTQLLKKIVANGESKASDETAPETPETAPSEEKKAKTGKTSPQARTKRKNSKKR